MVEDEASFIPLYQEMLPLHGLELIGYATDGEEAIEKIGEGLDPDIVLIDHRLPSKNGIDTMRELHRKDPSLPIVFMSADKTIMRDALKNGALDFLVKPFDKDQLFEMIDRHARKR
ncbi:MAG: response regulator [Methanobacteriota archaeon]|nr:MAG: response regulator [Euryarchaeota archaeon]